MHMAVTSDRTTHMGNIANKRCTCASDILYISSVTKHRSLKASPLAGTHARTQPVVHPPPGKPAQLAPLAAAVHMTLA